jgi:hypothetical protein
MCHPNERVRTSPLFYMYATKTGQNTTECYAMQIGGLTRSDFPTVLDRHGLDLWRQLCVCVCVCVFVCVRAQTPLSSDLFKRIPKI